MNGPSLALVPFARPEAHTALHRAVCRLGYSPLTVTPTAARDGGCEGQPRAVVYLLGAAARREQVLATLNCTRAIPSLAMFVQDEGDWDMAISERCCDFAQWPCAGEELAFRLGRLCGVQGAETPGALDPTIAETLAELNLIGQSPAFLSVVQRLSRLVHCAAPVLIEGETGTGKELAARAIHYLGPRAGGPFVPVNCGALPDHLVENELFGHERGAYTDAKHSAQGAIGEADGGTLFLDEVEALSPKAQAVLLRFLQDGEYRRLGDRRARRADTRVIAASNADMCSLVVCRELRSDLYFRLNILALTLPPLRERAVDIELLARHFIQLYCREYDTQVKILDGQSLRRLHDYPWPGNIRELENLIHREVLMTAGQVLNLYPGIPSDNPYARRGANDPGDRGAGFAAAKAKAIAEFERDYLTRLMAEAGGNVTQAGRIAGKERRTIGKLLKKYAIPAVAAT